MKDIKHKAITGFISPRITEEKDMEDHFLSNTNCRVIIDCDIFFMKTCPDI